LRRFFSTEYYPISFAVHSILDLELYRSGLGGIGLKERAVAPYIKDYDQLSSSLTWTKEFDITNWGIFLAVEAGKNIGGAAVAWNTNGVDMLEGRWDLSVLWDIRVEPGLRRGGVGKFLFDHAVAWSRPKGCVQMKIEIQNINVTACRFYSAMGAELGDIRRFAYRSEPMAANEVQLNWYVWL